jgi:hypothetical protein
MVFLPAGSAVVLKVALAMPLPAEVSVPVPRTTVPFMPPSATLPLIVPRRTVNWPAAT